MMIEKIRDSEYIMRDINKSHEDSIKKSLEKIRYDIGSDS